MPTRIVGVRQQILATYTVCANSEGWRCVLWQGSLVAWNARAALEGEGGGVECFEERVADWLSLRSDGRPAKGPWQDCRFQLGSVVS